MFAVSVGFVVFAAAGLLVVELVVVAAVAAIVVDPVTVVESFALLLVDVSVHTQELQHPVGFLVGQQLELEIPWQDFEQAFVCWDLN